MTETFVQHAWQSSMAAISCVAIQLPLFVRNSRVPILEDQ